MTDSPRDRARALLAERDPHGKRPSVRLALIADLCDELDAKDKRIAELWDLVRSLPNPVPVYDD